MIKYLQKIKDLISNFVSLNVSYILRLANARADLLSKLATQETANLKRSSYLEILECLSIKEALVI